MTSLINKIIEAHLLEHILTDGDLHNLMDKTPAARYAAVNKALKKNELIQLRRGLYLPIDKHHKKKVSIFYIASRLVPHSYISLESALSYHSWIPEKVNTVTCISAQRSGKAFTNTFGEFIYHQLPINEYEFLTGVLRIEEIKGQPFLMASPLRALADFVYINKIDWNGLTYLTESLRIDSGSLEKMDMRQFHEVKKIYRSKRVLNFLDELDKALQK